MQAEVSAAEVEKLDCWESHEFLEDANVIAAQVHKGEVDGLCLGLWRAQDVVQAIQECQHGVSRDDVEARDVEVDDLDVGGREGCGVLDGRVLAGERFDE